MIGLTDEALHALLRDDVERGWTAFIDEYTPVLLALGRRAGVSDHDEALDLYVRVCRHLGERRCERLRRHDPKQGSLRAWLTVVVRHVAADWVRSRAGRRRVFAAVRALPAFDREVFELYYWDERTPSEIVGVLGTRHRRQVALPEVLDALERVQAALSQRQRGELLSLALRAQAPEALEAGGGEAAADPPDSRPDPELSLRRKEAEQAFAEALARLAPEEAAIVRLKFVQGLTHREIQLALHLERLTDDRVKAILAKLRGFFTGHPRDSVDRSLPGLTFLEGPSR